MAEVGLFAMKRDQINRAILPFAVAGIEVDIVQMSPIALYNFITFDQLKGSGSKDSVVLLDIGADNTDLIITDGTRIWQRNVPIGGNHFTRALTKELKLTFAKAEHLKRNATKAPDPRAIFTAMRGVFNDFASEINRSIGFYSSINRTAKIRKVDRPGQRVQAAGPAEVPPAEPEPRGREARGVRAAGRRRGQDGARSSRTTCRRSPSPTAWASRGSSRSGAAHEPAAARDRAGPADPRQEAVGAGGLGAAHARASRRCSWAITGVLAKVDNDAVQGGRRRRPRASTEQGAEVPERLRRGQGRVEGQVRRGQGADHRPGDRGMWPEFLKTISAYFPDPVRDYKLDPDKPEDQDKLDKLRVHIDAIKPVWRNDVAAEWFDDRDPRRLQEPDAPARPRHAAQRRGLDRPDRRPPLQSQPRPPRS